MGAIAQSFGLLLPALLLTQAAAQVQFTNSNYDGITAGKPFDITFAGDGSPVTIYLKQGPSTNLQIISTIVSDTTTSPYTWAPATTIATGVYALEITQGDMTNYSPMFNINGALFPPSSTTTSTSSSSMNMSSTVDYTTGYSVPTGYFPSYATGVVVPSGYNATGGYATGVVVPSGYNMTTGGMPMGPASSTGVMAMPSQMTSFEGAGSRVGVTQWVACVMGAAVVVVW